MPWVLFWGPSLILWWIVFRAIFNCNDRSRPSRVQPGCVEGLGDMAREALGRALIPGHTGLSWRSPPPTAYPLNPVAPHRIPSEPCRRTL
jgi:hypothetical protein